MWLTNKSLCSFVYCIKIRLLFHSISHNRTIWHQYFLLVHQYFLLVHQYFLLVQSTSMDSLNRLANNITTYCFKLHDGKQCTILWWTDLCRIMSVEWNSCTGKIYILEEYSLLIQTWCVTLSTECNLAIRMMACSLQEHHNQHATDCMRYTKTFWTYILKQQINIH